jgi:hypothetical protein
MLVTPLMELTAVHQSTSTRAPAMDPPIVSGLHQAVAFHRPQAAPAYPTTVARTSSWMTDQTAPSTVVPVPRNDGMNQRNVVPNSRIATAVTVLDRDIPFSFPLYGVRLQPPVRAQTEHGEKDPGSTGRSDSRPCSDAAL